VQDQVRFLTFTYFRGHCVYDGHGLNAPISFPNIQIINNDVCTYLRHNDRIHKIDTSMRIGMQLLQEFVTLCMMLQGAQFQEGTQQSIS
jgi:hypothetical protein